MRIKLGFIAGVAALALAVPMTSQAWTTVASCSGSAATGASASCTKTFVCPAHTVNLRAEPGFTYRGALQVAVTDGVTTAAQDTYWVTGRIQLDGPAFTTAQFLPGATCTLTIIANAPDPEAFAGGTFFGRVEA